MCWCPTSTSPPPTGSTTGGLKSSLTGFRCTMEHSWQSTQPWCPPLPAPDSPGPQGRQPGSPALRAARQAKERTYPELVRGNRCRLVVLAMEVGGKWSHEAAEFLRLLAQARSRSVPHVLRTAAIQASIARWSALLTHAAQAPFAASLILQDPASQSSTDGNTPPLSTLLEHHPGNPPPPSRLPIRP